MCFILHSIIGLVVKYRRVVTPVETGHMTHLQTPQAFIISDLMEICVILVFISYYQAIVKRAHQITQNL